MLGVAAVGFCGGGLLFELPPPPPHPSRTITEQTAALPIKVLTGLALQVLHLFSVSAQGHTPNGQFDHPEKKPVNSLRHSYVRDTKLGKGLVCGVRACPAVHNAAQTYSSKSVAVERRPASSTIGSERLTFAKPHGVGLRSTPYPPIVGVRDEK